MSSLCGSQETTSMELNEIKKTLYKGNPKADLMYIDKERMLYVTNLGTGSIDGIINFSIPLGDIQDAKFLPVMEAKLLIRWLI